LFELENFWHEIKMINLQIWLEKEKKTTRREHEKWKKQLFSKRKNRK